MLYENPPPPVGYEWDDLPEITSLPNIFSHESPSVSNDLILPHLSGIENSETSDIVQKGIAKDSDEIQKEEGIIRATNEELDITTPDKNKKKRKAPLDIESCSEVQGKSIEVLQTRTCVANGRKKQKLNRPQFNDLSSVDSDESDFNNTSSEITKYKLNSKPHSKESTNIHNKPKHKHSRICKHKNKNLHFDDDRHIISDRIKYKSWRDISSSEEQSLRHRRSRLRSPTMYNRRSILQSPEFRIKQELFSDDDRISYLGKHERLESDRFSEIDEDGISKWCSPKKEGIKKIIREEDMDCKDKQFYGVDVFYCSFCKLSLNSELTYQSHLLGQRHAKAIRAQSVHEVARSSLITNNYPTPVFEESNRHDKPPPGIERVELKKAVASIQEVCDDYQDRQLIMGLKHVWEIRGKTETSYYCNLCDAPCGASSVMPHLTGFKHRLMCFKQYFPELYDRHKDDYKKDIEKIIKYKFWEHKRRFRKQKIRVFKDVPICDFQPSRTCPWDQPGPSWQSSPFSERKEEPVIVKNENEKPVVPSNQEFLDTRYADFHCTVCDSHMNNIAMWEAHIRGKRHLKNLNKDTQGIAATSKYVEAPAGTVSNLEKEINKVCIADEIIVGLNYIRENQGKNGNQYNCFPCGGCCSDLDIIDHILSMKHKIKYLEKMNVDGFKNNIVQINNIQIATYFREQMVDAECQEMMKRYGRGKPKVYLIKRDLKNYGPLT